MTRTLIGMLITVLLTATGVAAQEAKRDIYANPQNLQVLPEEISSQELRETMKGFAMGLGVRCENCHVGEAGKPLDTFDFRSDEKPMKDEARVMIKMLQTINDGYVASLDEIEKAEHRVPVRCVTCHRGRERPELIEDVMNVQLADGSVDTAVAKYTELRDKYYGSHSFDFSEFALATYAQGLAEQGNTDAAIALLDVNAGHFPESYYTQFLLGEIHGMAGNRDKALASYARAIELNPRAAGFLKQRMEKVKNK